MQAVAVILRKLLTRISDIRSFAASTSLCCVFAWYQIRLTDQYLVRCERGPLRELG